MTNISPQDESWVQNDHRPLFQWNSCAEYLDPPNTVKKHEIRRIDIYDFDNTLFKSPAPNPNLLSSFTINVLTDPNKLSNGGWWSEKRFLQESIDEWIAAKKNAGTDTDEVDATYWNKDVVELTRLSQQDPHTLSILMTGRKELLFQSALSCVLEQPVFGPKKLHFNGVFLKKPNFETTMLYKTTCLTDLLKHYNNCDEITIYDDRVRQLQGFKKFLNEFVEALRPSLQFNLIHVAGLIKYLNPPRERSTITTIFDEHNAAVTKCIYQQQESKTGSFYMGKMYVKEKRLGAAYILTTMSRQKVVKLTMRKFGHMKELFNDRTHFTAKFIPCTPHGTITSQKVATMVLEGSHEEPTEETIETTMSLMNSGKEDPRIQFRLTRFGRSARGIFVYDAEPVPSSRFVYSDFPALRLAVTAAADQESETASELYDDDQFQWTALDNDDTTIETNFGYEFVITAVMGKKPKRSKKQTTFKMRQ